MIDLIIPAYNAEDTIGRALASVAAQTKSRKFLVTIIDDCSTDCTAAVVNKFKGIIPLQYIKLEQNLGKPGLVRNIGIEKTSCPYIMFLDADDILSPIAGETLARAAIQKTPDIIFSSFYCENRESDEKEQYKIYGPNSITWLHGNLYSRKFLSDNNIKFDHRMNEDGSFNLKCINISNNIMKIEKPMAYWLNNNKSLTRSNDKFMLDISQDYLDTYMDAIDFILKVRPEIINNKEFKQLCAYKLGEFFEFCEANYANNRQTLNLLTTLKSYVKLLNDNQILDKNCILLANERFNEFKVFCTAVRHHTIFYYFDWLNIEYTGVF